jgi:exodeoxyribonuclease III
MCRYLVKTALIETSDFACQGSQELVLDNRPMKIATWNVNSLTVRLPQVLDWLAHNPVDALGLQELKMTDDKFPHAEFEAMGYHAAAFGQKTYNGVALLTRQPVDSVQKNIPGFADEQSRIIAGTLATALGPVRIVNGCFVNGQAPDSDKFAYKLRWLSALQDWLRTELVQHPRLVLVGDFNITADDRDSYDPEGLRETIHHTTIEREHLQALVDLGLHDSFRLFEQADKSFSWWDYRDFGFRRNRGLRIDYVLVSDALKAQTVACMIDKLPRKNERPSDHAPVVMELA